MTRHADPRNAFNWRTGEPTVFALDTMNFARKEAKTEESVLRRNKQSNISYSTRNADKTNKIIGRRLNARSQ